MKIAVYTICKNEEQFVNKWINSAKDADYLIVTDTGSSDNTYELLNNYANNVEVNLKVSKVDISPWRFDDARQFNLMQIPSDADLCICLDMDEVLTEGWRARVEEAWNTQSFDRLRYNYVWSWNTDGSPGVTYYGDKIHKRHGFRWVNPVHEVLSKDLRLTPELQYYLDDKPLIEHYPDTNKSRSSYLVLLSLSVKENPLNDRNAFYYARELMYHGQYKEAVIEFTRHLELPTALWKPERSASYRFMGDCLWALGKFERAEECFGWAIVEDPTAREPYVSMAQALRYKQDWEGVIEMCRNALAIVDRPNSYICQPSAWSDWPETMLNEAREKKGLTND